MLQVELGFKRWIYCKKGWFKGGSFPARQLGMKFAGLNPQISKTFRPFGNDFKPAFMIILWILY